MRKLTVLAPGAVPENIELFARESREIVGKGAQLPFFAQVDAVVFTLFLGSGTCTLAMSGMKLWLFPHIAP